MDTRFAKVTKHLQNARIPDDAIVTMLAKKEIIVTVEEVQAARAEVLAAVQAAADLADAAKGSQPNVGDVVEKAADTVEHAAEAVAAVAGAAGAAPVAAVAQVVAEVAHVVEAIAASVDPPRAVRVTAKGDGRVAIPGRRSIRVSFKGVHIGEEAQLLWEHARHLVEPFAPKK